MNSNAVKISGNFRKMAIRSVWSILLFIFTYLLLMACAIGFTVLCGYAGVMLIVVKPMFVTLMFGLGLISLGFLILFFLLKFIFSSSKIDRSHLIPIFPEDQPVLFKFIEEIVDEVKTTSPKNVYLSSEVNASVFYDSSFWSMFFPVRKNLQIGVALMNSISVTELKAILAHEFGHFSQRSMKVGSYVYNVNRVIYNMLYDNDSYSSGIQKWASFSSYFAVFVQLAIKIITGIQTLLKKVYEIVNLNYMALSREMEFHADAVAAQVAGSQPLISSLLRLELADNSLNAVFNYYSGKIEEGQKTDNLYPQQYFVMNFLATESKLQLKGGLPQVTLEFYKRFNKTKLVLKDQWSSHPSTEDRVAQLTILNKEAKNTDNTIASKLLRDSELIQKNVTSQIFDNVSYKISPTIIANEEFNENYLKYYEENTYSDFYKGYFDERNPLTSDVQEFLDQHPNQPLNGPNEFFAENIIHSIYTERAMKRDLEILEQIESGILKVKTFDYDGQKYIAADCRSLILDITKEKEDIEARLKETDINIFRYFYFMASEKGQIAEFKEIYISYKTLSDAYVKQIDLYNNLSASTQFIHTTLPYDVIEQNLIAVKALEKNLRTELEFILNTEAYHPYITDVIKSNIDKYLSKDWLYFNTNEYFDEGLNTLFTAMYDYYYLVQNGQFKLKKNLLDFQIKLVSDV